MWMRVLRKFECPNQRGELIEYDKGELVDVLNKHLMDRYLSAGLITHPDYSHMMPPEGQPAPPFRQTKRVGIYLTTTSHYSGGRIHMYQYAHTLASLGAEVFMITNAFPRWANDYPPEPRLRVLIQGKDPIPKDLDVIVTDSKQKLGKDALRWRQAHAQVPFVCFNFETPNWVTQYEPGYARKLQSDKGVFGHADLLICNSDLSLKHCLEWLGKPVKSGVVNPCVNTYALEASKKLEPGMPAHPYAVYSARPTAYKGGKLVVDSIWSLDIPFDLVVFGQLNHPPKETQIHKFYQLKGEPDAKKFKLMREAHMVLAPSKFEGFGMVPGEALAAGTRCIVYDLPVLHEAYGAILEYVPWDDGKAFKEKVHAVARSPKHNIPESWREHTIKEHGMESMKAQVQALPYHAVTRKSVSAHMICLWGFVPEALEAIYHHVDEIKIAFGPDRINEGFPPDGSLEKIQAFPDPDKKIELEVRKVWKDKQEMRSWCTDRISGNYHLLLDADEIWVGLKEWIESGYAYSCPRWINLWHGAGHWVYDNAKMAGLRWGKKMEPYGSVCPHYRWSWWRASYKWKRHPCVVDANDKLLHKPNNAMVMETVPTCVIYHLGHALPRRIMKAKHNYYRKRDGDNEGRRKRQRSWENWTGKIGDSGDGIIEAVNWEIPDIVKRAVKSLEDLK